MEHQGGEPDLTPEVIRLIGSTLSEASDSVGITSSLEDACLSAKSRLVDSAVILRFG
jgi:hypothetical protein